MKTDDEIRNELLTIDHYGLIRKFMSPQEINVANKMVKEYADTKVDIAFPDMIIENTIIDLHSFCVTDYSKGYEACNAEWEENIFNLTSDLRNKLSPLKNYIAMVNADKSGQSISTVLLDREFDNMEVSLSAILSIIRDMEKLIGKK